MISTDAVQTLIGSTVYDPDGDKLGTIGQVYLDDDSGTPEWATVKTGLLGLRESFVPLHQAELSGDGVRIPYDKQRVKGAPSIDSDREVSPEEVAALHQYYGLSAGSGLRGDTIGGVATDRATSERYDTERATSERYDTERTMSEGYDTSGPTTDDAMTRSEERVRAGTEEREAGRARLRKYVVTEQQQVNVPVSHEEVRVEREPITDANRDRAMSGPELSDEEHEVILTEERPVVEKEAVPVERVRLSKDRVTDEESVDVDVRQERIDTDVDTR